MNINVGAATSPALGDLPVGRKAPSSALTADEMQMRDDYEFALHDDSVRQQYAGQVVVVCRRQILGVGKNHRDAWAAAQRNPSCPSKQHVAMVVVPEAIRP